MTEDDLNLWKRFRQGDETAFEELVLHHLQLVSFWVGEASRKMRRVNREDLMQEGITGLMKAVRKFDPDRGNEFTTYARQYIRGAIHDSPELTRSLPRRQEENYRKTREAHDELAEKLKRRPTIEEIAEKSELTVEQVNNAIDAMSIAFYDEFTGSEETAQANADIIERQQNTILIQNALAKLSNREATVLTLHYWEELSYPKIASRLGLTADAISKICQRAIEKLRVLYRDQSEGGHYES